MSNDDIRVCGDALTKMFNPDKISTIEELIDRLSEYEEYEGIQFCKSDEDITIYMKSSEYKQHEYYIQVDVPSYYDSDSKYRIRVYPQNQNDVCIYQQDLNIIQDISRGVIAFLNTTDYFSIYDSED